MQNNRATIYNTAILFLLLFVAAFTVRIQAQAQRATATPKPTATASAKPSATPTPATDTETSKETIDEIKRRIEKNSDLVKGVTDQQTDRVGLIGEVSRITGESLTVKTQTATVIMSLPENITITSGNKAVAASDIAVGNWVSIIGSDDDDTFVPASISVSTESLRPKPQEVTLGTITKISKTEIEFTPRSSETSKTLTITRTSSFEDSDGATAKLADFETDLAVLAVLQQNDEDLEIATLRSLVPLEE